MPSWPAFNPWRYLLILGLVGLLAVGAACNDDDDDEDTDEPSATEDGGGEVSKTVEALVAAFFPESGRVALREAIEQNLIDQFIFTDGTKSQSMFDEIGVESFEGMYGTQPGAANAEWAKLFAPSTEDPDAPYAKEGYDSAMLLMLAAASANSTDGTAIRDNLRFVANPPGEVIGIGPEEFGRALELLAAGDDIDYQGASGPADLDANGDLAAGTVAIWQINEGTIEQVDTREADLATTAGVEVPPGSQVRSDAAPTEALKLGSVISVTGDLSDYGPPINAGILLAVTHANDAGGVFDQPVTVAAADDGTLPEQGQAEARRLVDVEGVHAMVGSLSSGVTQAIAENVTSPANITLISPASTAAAITTAADNDFLFRLPIQDAAQGAVIAEIANDQGYTNICVLYVNTPYGQGLAEAITTSFAEFGGVVSEASVTEQEQPTYVSEITQCVGG